MATRYEDNENDPHRPPLHEGSDGFALGSKYTAWGIVETRSETPDAPPELSFYTSDEGYWREHVVMRRYTLRIDGFVSVNAPQAGGELVTKPLRFEGNRLVLNSSTSAAGSIRVEIQDQSGQAIAGFSLGDGVEIFGDSLEREVQWKNGPDVGRLAGQPVRLRFVLTDADLFAIRFRPGQ